MSLFRCLASVFHREELERRNYDMSSSDIKRFADERLNGCYDMLDANEIVWWWQV
jgi:hypothetical protein